MTEPFDITGGQRWLELEARLARIEWRLNLLVKVLIQGETVEIEKEKTP